jgi:hypothetical protein
MGQRFAARSNYSGETDPRTGLPHGNGTWLYRNQCRFEGEWRNGVRHGEEPTCRQAGDVNDDGRLDVSDAIGLLLYLFSQGAEPAPPFEQCGFDATTDWLSCKEYQPCE